MSAPVIAEDHAWEIANTFATDSREVLGAHLVAVVAVGSLPAGSYVPGRSDIDLVVVARDACPDGLLSEIKEMAKQYWVKYEFSKGFGGYGIHERDLSPPFGRLRDMVYEILQLKHQGRVIQGHLDLSTIPDPSEEEMKRSLADLVPDLLGAWKRNFPAPIDVADARVNNIIYWLRIFVWDRTGEYVLGKRNVLPAFSDLPGNDSLLEMLTPIRLYLDQEKDHPGDVARYCREVETFVLGEVEWAHRAAHARKSES